MNARHFQLHNSFFIKLFKLLLRKDVLEQSSMFFILVNDIVYWCVGPLTDDSRPPTVETLINNVMLKKPVNMLFDL